MLTKIDKQWIGILMGAFLPVLTFYAIYMFAYPGIRQVPIADLFAAKGLFSRILSLSVIPNVAVFFLFISTSKLNIARGLLIISMVFALVVFGIKLFG